MNAFQGIVMGLGLGLAVFLGFFMFVSAVANGSVLLGIFAFLGIVVGICGVFAVLWIHS